MKREKGPALYWWVRGATRVAAKIYLRFRAYGSTHVPETGGCILAPNHVSFLDPPLVGCALPHRMVHFMARNTLFHVPLLGWWIRRIGMIPIDRTKGDLAALRSALSGLKGGKVVALFPEGTRSLDGNLQEPKGGIGFLIAKARVPVVPVYVAGSYQALPKGRKWIKPKRVRVYFGEPIQPVEFVQGPGKPDYEAIVALVMSRIAELKTQAETTV